MNIIRGSLCLLTCSLFMLLSSCSNNGIAGGGELVTVSGVVFNIDTYSPAKGVVVYLLDNRDKYVSKPTGANGEYSLKVPAGSVFVLTTDDAAAAGIGAAGDWYPLINMDTYSAGATIDKDTPAWPVHACPTIKNLAKGSIYKYNNFINNATIAAGFFGSSTTVNDNAGIIVWSSNWLLDDGKGNITAEDNSSWTVAFDSPSFPTGYVSSTRWNDAGNANILQSGGGKASDAQGLAISIGDPSFGGQTVTATFVDPHHHPVNSPFEVQVRPNHISYVQPTTFNGKEANIQEFFQHFGLI